MGKENQKLEQVKEKKKKGKGKIIAILVAVVVIIVIIVAATSGSDSKNTDSSTSTSESSSNKSSLSVEEQVLWEVDDVKVTATGLDEDDIFGTGINVLVENDSDKDVGISADALIVNDYMFADLTSITVTAGNKTNESITLFSSELEAAGIEHIGQIELYLYTFDPDTYETIKKSDCITIKTSEYSQMETANNIKGTTLYEKDGIKITGQYVDNSSFWGQSVLLYIENNTNQNIIVQCDDVSVDGYMVSALLSSNVYSGKKSLDEIELLQSDLESNGITKINTIETSFSIMDEDYNEIANSGKVSFTVK